MQPVFDERGLGLSFEMVEVDPVTSLKKNNLHERLRKCGPDLFMNGPLRPSTSGEITRPCCRRALDLLSSTAATSLLRNRAAPPERGPRPAEPMRWCAYLIAAVLGMAASGRRHGCVRQCLGIDPSQDVRLAAGGTPHRHRQGPAASPEPLGIRGAGAVRRNRKPWSLVEMETLEKLGTEAPPRRRSRLFMSRGYQHYRLLELIEETRTDLDCVLAAADIREEMHCWGLAAQHFGDEQRLDLALSMLRSARLIPKDGQMPFTAQDPEVWYGEYGRGILQYIVVPYLADAAARAEPVADTAGEATRDAPAPETVDKKPAQAVDADSDGAGR